MSPDDPVRNPGRRSSTPRAKKLGSSAGGLTRAGGTGPPNAKRLPKTRGEGLQAAQAPVAAASESAVAVGGQHYATFTVELLLAEDNEVRRTRVTHIQSGQEETWPGWQEDRLLATLSPRAALRPPTGATSVAAVMPPLSGVLRLSEPETSSEEAGGPRNILPSDQPFVVRLVLDLTEVNAPSGFPLECAARVWAKDLAGPRQVVGVARGPVTAGTTMSLTVRCGGLGRGTYRLETVAGVCNRGVDPVARAQVTAAREGGLLLLC